MIKVNQTANIGLQNAQNVKQRKRCESNRSFHFVLYALHQVDHPHEYVIIVLYYTVIYLLCLLGFPKLKEKNMYQ